MLKLLQRLPDNGADEHKTSGGYDLQMPSSKFSEFDNSWKYHDGLMSVR